MAIDATKWKVNTDKSIEYIGGDHGTATTNYITVLELHRWLMDIADDASVADHGSDDFMDITTLNPSDKSFDTLINLVNGYYLKDTGTTPAVEFVYGGSIIQNNGSGEQWFDGIKVVANQGITVNIAQNDALLTNDFWNNVPDGSKTDSTATVTGVNSTGQKVLNVSSSSVFAAGDYIVIGTVVDECYQIDEIINGTSVRLTENLGTATTGGETIYDAVRGINSDAANGVAQQFMVKVKDTGAEIDNTALIFTTREWYKTYSEFRVPSTGRGVNTIPLTYAADLNNTTALNTVSGWTTIENTGSEGFTQIDVNQDSTNEDYYSEWNRDTYSINQFYERMKYLTWANSAETLYGENGPEFRGITHAIEFTAAATPSPFADLDTLYWDTDASQAKVLAMDTTNHIAYVQLLKGVVPGDSETIYDAASQTGNSASTLASNGTSEKTLSTPFCGQSTGSSLVGAYGFTLEYADLAVNDKIQALDGVTRQPPNNVTFTVYGVENGYRVLVGPEDGASGLDYDQLSNTNLLNGAAVTSVEVDEAIPANTPTSGTIRIQRADGQYTRHPYSAVNTGTKTFTITSHDFSTNNAAIGANIFISYIDDAATGTSISFNTVQSSTQTLYVEARYGGTGPGYTDAIKPAKSTGTLNSAGGSSTLSPVSDA